MPLFGRADRRTTGVGGDESGTGESRAMTGECDDITDLVGGEGVTGSGVEGFSGTRSLRWSA